MKKTILALSLAFSFNSAFAGLTETIPTNHWIYKNIQELKLRGKLTKLDLNNLPFTKGEIVKAFGDETWSDEFGYEKVLRTEIENELESEFDSKGNSSLQAGFILEPKFVNADKNYRSRFDLTAESRTKTEKETESKTTVFLRTDLGFEVNEYLGVYQKILLDGELDYELSYSGNERFGLRGYNESAYILANYKFLTAKLGRDYLTLGPGRTGKLVFSDNSEPFDQYFVELKNRFAKFSFFGIKLDKSFADDSTSTQFAVDPRETGFFLSNRYVNGHRLDLNFLDGRLNLGLSEIYLYSGENRNFELNYVNPMGFYTGEQANDDLKGEGGNSILSFDFDYYLKNNLRLYGGVVIDDYQIDDSSPEDLEPTEMGILIGADWADFFGLSGYTFSAEYFRVTNRTFNGQDKGAEKFLHRTKPIAHPFGNNFELFDLQVSGRILPKLHATLGGKFYRKGDLNIIDRFNKDYLNATVEEGYEEDFPFVSDETKKVEKTLEYSLALEYIHQENLRAVLDVDFANVSNYQNISGEKFSGISYFKFGIWYDFSISENF